MYATPYPPRQESMTSSAPHQPMNISNNSSMMAASTPQPVSMVNDSNHNADETDRMVRSRPATSSSGAAAAAAPGHRLSMDDPDNPLNWPIYKKIYTSLVSAMFAFTILYGTTTYTTATAGIMQMFNISTHLAIFGFTAPFFGVFFAPIYTPHLSEKLGRRPIYFTSMPLFALMVLAGGLAQNFQTIAVTRFFAGLFGGPCLVLIEGTFADIWDDPRTGRTVTYYAFLTLASYWGAGFGQVIGGFTLAARGPQWLSWVALIFAIFSLAFGAAMPETYGREILRRRIRARGGDIKILAPAQSGEKLSEMAVHTLLNPLRMLISEPLVIATSLYVGLNFAVVFQWFISVPAVLSMVYSFEVPRVGLAFLSAVCGAGLAVICCLILDAIAFPKRRGLSSSSAQHDPPAPIERRMLPAMFGGILVVGSLFWIGFTASPRISFYVPIFGTGVYVWGNMMILVSFISYLFDAYPPAGTLSALTAVACVRIACAGIVPIFILDMITNLTGSWAFGTFALISLAMLPLPFFLYFKGATLRSRSSFSEAYGQLEAMQMQDMQANTSYKAV